MRKDPRRLQIFTGIALAACAGIAPRVMQVEPVHPAPAISPSFEAVPPKKVVLEEPDPNVAPVVATKTCPMGTMLDDGACIHLPEAWESEDFGEDPVGAPEGLAVETGHHEKSGAWLAYEQIPRRPDRPADYDAYVYPIPCALPGGHCVVSGYDLDLPDPLQRRGDHIKAVGHGAVDLPQVKGTPIRMIELDHQVGDALVLHVGKLMGTSVVTLHTIREGGRLREYVLIFGHLQRPAANLKPGDSVKLGQLVGFVGDTGSPELVHLHLEARRVRDGVDGTKLVTGTILAQDATIVCDPRNVLPLKDAIPRP